ncbi:ribosome small subunit-dependent GTPase A [Fructilactobacillus fructivorans]|uniref:Small ribosomal subunit biogenesis GTPase RsgA n=1 Tax=Fructilactobacillus fructivorans TaxID=1614 RepID=A0A0C1PN21_9LACO|nr:ribosome small subunit-dependent GTPase A [Fructilactobacillus fructivorans]KID42157.1 Ribosome small subunit-stimulated GTPase EngC [Fructilactobacillus fructivorans]MCT0152050.1 ribosome small subunit-dependent GTPase A [Fructilactobacillus fructivorans]MCT2867942.1 ribosome small subunit-dependent GTPase A [Fructilactobacillus fructivorans]MCT2868476.1 ribosome small subunit-dependent GTPase A [Fructilactobacillus fructivorans]MCT2873476.1 ribosome small subunit-dependent GTPase A [Fruct
MKKGKIYQSLSGFYDVKSDGKVYRTKARGNFRKKNIKPIVGDMVEFDITNVNEGYILKMLPRFNELIRPPVANTDQAVVVSSAVEPDFSFSLLDKQLVALEKQKITPIIYISKTDLLSSEKQIDFFKKIAKDYRTIGYDVILPVEVDDPHAINEVAKKLPHKQSIVMGQTGSGKSTLLNQIDPELKLKTGEVSKSLSRGKHTTRKVSLLTVNEGLIADTPGFSSFDTLDIKSNELKNYFPEFKRVSANCKFRECLHVNEPGCAVKAGVESGTILKSRYDDYLQEYNLLKAQKPVYNKKRGN